MSQPETAPRSSSRVFSSIRVLCRLAILAALYVLLTMVSIRAGNLRVTFASLPVVVCALLFGPWEAFWVALIGEFINQMLSYGPTVTTVLWLLPPALRGAAVGAAAFRSLRAGRPLEARPRALYAVCLAAAVLTTACNTAVLAVDGLLYHYFTWVLVFGDLAVRLATGLLTAVIVTSLARPLAGLLRRQLNAGRF
jgi:ECF transporter S component (folate family)